MHFVGVALEPPEKTAHPVPALVVLVLLLALALLALDHEILVGLRQFLERKMDVDFFARAGSQQILL